MVKQVHTLAPASAYAVATAKPIPRPPPTMLTTRHMLTVNSHLPVIATTLPVKSKSFWTGASSGLERTILNSQNVFTVQTSRQKHGKIYLCSISILSCLHVKNYQAPYSSLTRKKKATVVIVGPGVRQLPPSRGCPWSREPSSRGLTPYLFLGALYHRKSQQARSKCIRKRKLICFGLHQLGDFCIFLMKSAFC